MIQRNSQQASAPRSQATVESSLNYFVVFINYPRRLNLATGVLEPASVQAVVDTDKSREDIIGLIRTGEYDADRIEFIHHVTMNDTPQDVTAELIGEAVLARIDDDNDHCLAADRIAFSRDRARDYAKETV